MVDLVSGSLTPVALKPWPIRQYCGCRQSNHGRLVCVADLSTANWRPTVLFWRTWHGRHKETPQKRWIICLWTLQRMSFSSHEKSQVKHWRWWRTKVRIHHVLLPSRIQNQWMLTERGSFRIYFSIFFVQLWRTTEQSHCPQCFPARAGQKGWRRASSMWKTKCGCFLFMWWQRKYISFKGLV